MKYDIRLPPIEVDIDIGGSPNHDLFLILEVIPWRSMNCILQGLTTPETAMNYVKVACKSKVRFADQSKVAPLFFRP